MWPLVCGLRVACVRYCGNAQSVHFDTVREAGKQTMRLTTRQILRAVPLQQEGTAVGKGVHCLIDD